MKSVIKYGYENICLIVLCFKLSETKGSYIGAVFQLCFRMCHEGHQSEPGGTEIAWVTLPFVRKEESVLFTAAVSDRCLTAEARGRSQVSPCVIGGGYRSTGTGLFPVLRYNSAKSPYLYFIYVPTTLNNSRN